MRGIVLSFRNFINATLVVALLAGTTPYLTCMSGMCAANSECASMRCQCCGPDCPWQKSSHESHQKHDKGCNQQCPLIIASKAVTISNSLPLAAAVLGVTGIQPVLFGYTSFYKLPVRQPASLRSPTLLSLACALTI